MSKSHPIKFNTDLRDQKLLALAQEHLSIETLETRNRDSLDFYDVSVWSVKSALEEAYLAGMDAAGSRPHSKL